MKIIVNGEARDAQKSNLAQLCDVLGYGGAKVATALNGVFVPAKRRAETMLRDGDAVEIVAPREGG